MAEFIETEDGHYITIIDGVHYPDLGGKTIGEAIKKTLLHILKNIENDESNDKED